jgi:plastocyanin
MKMLRSRAALAIATPLVALLASCGGGGGDSAPADTVPTDALVVKAVQSLRFDAAEYGPVPAGEVTIGYVNEDSVRHTLILAKDGTKVANFKLEVVKDGDVDTGSVALEAGTYQVICDVPGHSAMVAELIVQ